MMKMQPLLLDVRTPEEFAGGHFVGATLVPTPLPPLGRRQLRTLRQRLSAVMAGKLLSRPIWVYCKKGIRSGHTKNILEEFGFTNIIDLGGITNEPLKSKIMKTGWSF